MAMFDTDVDVDREHSGSFLYLSVPWYAARELWLQSRAHSWVRVDATIQESHRTKGGTRETIRAEAWYGYKLGEKHYVGHLIRDGVFGSQRVINRYPAGATVSVLVNPAKPEQSYLPSGIGYIEPVIIGAVGIATLCVLVGALTVLVFSSLHR